MLAIFLESRGPIIPQLNTTMVGQFTHLEPLGVVLKAGLAYLTGV